MGLDQQAKTYSSPCYSKQSLPGPLSPSVGRSIKCGPIPVPTTGGGGGEGVWATLGGGHSGSHLFF